MYAQQHSRRSEATPAAVPRNYSGNAFRYPPPTAVTPIGAREEETMREERVQEHIPAELERGAEVEKEESAGREQGGDALETTPEAEERLRLPALFPHGVGNEELLLLGLLLLLSGKEDGERSELPLYLLLLLFCA